MPQKPPPGAIPGMVPPDVMSMMEQGFAQNAQSQKTNIQYAPQTSGVSQQKSQPQQTGFQHQHTPRDVGSITEEAQLMAKDVGEGLLSVVPDEILQVLGLKRAPKTPEENTKLQQFHHGWQRLTQEEQQVAQERLRAEAERKQKFEEEKQMKKQQEEKAKKDQTLHVPQGKVSGQAALDKMMQDRKGMGGASG